MKFKSIKNGLQARTNNGTYEIIHYYSNTDTWIARFIPKIISIGEGEDLSSLVQMCESQEKRNCMFANQLGNEELQIQEKI